MHVKFGVLAKLIYTNLVMMITNGYELISL